MGWLREKCLPTGGLFFVWRPAHGLPHMAKTFRLGMLRGEELLHIIGKEKIESNYPQTRMDARPES